MFYHPRVVEIARVLALYLLSRWRILMHDGASMQVRMPARDAAGEERSLETDRTFCAIRSNCWKQMGAGLKSPGDKLISTALFLEYFPLDTLGGNL